MKLGLPLRLRPLNEGRGLNPGDTAGGAGRSGNTSTAQRRPGPEPRRHEGMLWNENAAGVSLNEGRGLNPGDTGGNLGAEKPNILRSTKAGA